MTPHEAEAVEREAFGWLGTPFAPGQGLKGVGADCVGLWRGVYADCGLLPPGIVFPEYLLGDGWRIEPFMDAWFDRVPVQAGCVAAFEVGEGTAHMGIVLSGERLAHSVRRRGVVLESLASRWTPRFVACWGPR